MCLCICKISGKCCFHTTGCCCCCCCTMLTHLFFTTGGCFSVCGVAVARSQNGQISLKINRKTCVHLMLSLVWMQPYSRHKCLAKVGCLNSTRVTLPKGIRLTLHLLETFPNMENCMDQRVSLSFLALVSPQFWPHFSLILLFSYLSLVSLSSLSVLSSLSASLLDSFTTWWKKYILANWKSNHNTAVMFLNMMPTHACSSALIRDCTSPSRVSTVFITTVLLLWLLGVWS